MKILFHTNTLNYRGTTVAITDYAKYTREILGLEPVIAYCKTNGQEKDMGNEPTVIESLEKQFEVIGYRAGDLEKKIDQHNIDLAYFINSGKKEELPANCKTAVHAVFQFYEPHGDRYAYISEWLSKHMTNGHVPFVPHMVHLPTPNKNFREHLGIRQDQIIIGRIGGYFTFDLPFVKDMISRLVYETDQFVFLFVGTEPFIDHPQVKFINELHEPQKKANFINSCDAMLHARTRGESFGLSIAEFLFLNKPVFAWRDGHDMNHREMLHGSGTLYADAIQLKSLLFKTKDFQQQEDWSTRVKPFNPTEVMMKFKEVFL